MLVVPAYAKVNLGLEVTGRRADGWHDLATVIATVDWHDLVGLQLVPTSAGALPAAAAGAPPGVGLRVTGPFAEGVPADDTNIALRAARLLLNLAGDPPLALHLHLRKEVPSAAGMGGGSADAAAVLRAGASLLAATGRPLSAADLSTAAAELGSDVPAVLAGGTLLATGRGEVLTRLPAPDLHLAIAMAGPSSTAAAYAALSDAERTASGRVASLAAALNSGAAIDEAHLGSALEPAACRAAPGLADTLARLRATTPDRRWHLTGSGGAAFAMATSPADAARLAAAAAAAGFPARACRTVATHLGPLPPGSRAS